VTTVSGSNTSIDAAALLERVSDAVIVFDKSWHYVYVNAAAERLCGHSRASLLKRNFWDFFPQGHTHAFEPYYRQAMAERKPLIFREFYAPAKRWLEVRALPSQDVLAVFIRDITDRIAAEESDSTSEQKYRLLMERNPDGVFTLNPEGRLVFVNPACVTLTGYGTDELLGRSFQDLCAPDQMEKALRRFQRTVAGEMPENLETALITKDGRRIDILVTGGPILQEGKVVAVHCGFKDVTASKRLSAALRQREGQYRTLVENAPDIIERFDRQLRFVYANPALERYTGMPASHFVGKTKKEAGIPEPLCSLWEVALTEVFTIGEERGFEFTYDAPTGKVHMCARLVPEFDVDHKVEYVLSVIRDISEQKRCEQALQAARDEARVAEQAARSKAEDLAALMEVVPASIWLAHDPLCHRITGNHASHELFGIAGLDNLSQTPPDGEYTPTLRSYCNGKELPAAEFPLQQAAAQGREIRDIELEVHRPDGGCKTIYGHAFPLRHEDGTIRGSVAAFMDITSFKDAQIELQKAKDAAERANCAKDHFLAILSHELRNPLTPVLTTAELMEQDTSLSAEQRAAVELIHRNVSLETRLIDDLLDLNRLAHGKISLQCCAVDVHEVVHQAIRTCRADIQSKDLRIKMKMSAEQTHVDADPARLQQVIWNLLRNAIKFTPAGGTITFSTDNGSAGTVAIKVEDTGVGIAPEKLAHIFKAFEQGGADVNKQYGGLGLGLAISKTLAELHRGTLAAHSDGAGCGAAFTLQLPLLTTPHTLTSIPDSMHVAASCAAPRAHLGNILLVEDHLDTVEVMAHLLRTFGYHVRTASTIAGALKAANEMPFDILISDIGLPDGSGLELMAKLSREHPIPAIALSGFGMEEDIRRSKDAGFRVHLTKPVDLQALDRALRNLTTT